MRRLRVPNRVFFYSAGFACDCYNYIAILGEVLLADTRLRASELRSHLQRDSGCACQPVPVRWLHVSDASPG